MGAMTGPATGPHPIRRVLIANRGEIAVRIARGARESGIVPLGIYSAADARAVHVDVMDDALCIGPAAAAQSYLDIARVIAAAVRLGADAVHPGYGFLSERADFARAVRAAGMTFVGPTAEAIAAMGDKTEAKRRAREVDVPVVPGYDGDDQSLAGLRVQATLLGPPLLVKAAAGGGGRGMRVVLDLADFDEALAAAQREALAAFGDARVLLERYVERPRHIEFQILADAFGTTIHLGERECSIQRRHQKVLEEAPSPALDAALRDRMGAAAVRAAQSVSYTNAGTVEFLLDPHGAFYFLEMNARLQVEHPVTELVHGIDLVRAQFALASGLPLGLRQADVVARGVAIEARINAENASGGYVPAAGTIERFDAPSGPGIRLDSGVRAGSEVSIFYDSMLAKLIAYGETREIAIDRLTAALAAFRIEGLDTNLALLLRIARDPVFRSGATTTAFLEDREVALAPESATVDEALLLAVGALLSSSRAWRIASVGIPLRLEGCGRALALSASRAPDGDEWQLRGDVARDIAVETLGDRVTVSVDGRRIAGRAELEPSGVAIVFSGERFRFSLAAPPQLGAGSDAGGQRSGAVVSPMPGKIVKVAVRAGDTVLERDLLVVLEAMKMEHRIEAARDGIVASVAVEAGDLVCGGAMLVEMDA